MLPITFFLAEERDLAALEAIDPDREWRHFVRGEGCWVLQTYLRLKRRGLDAQLATAAPAEGLLLFHTKHRRTVAAAAAGRPDLVLVGIRADGSSPAIADLEILQNGCRADGRRRFFIPLWPQAGLVPRDPARGTELRNASFKGFSANLHPDLRTPAWTRFLEQQGITWEADMVAYAGKATEESSLAWNDYSSVDLVIALRPTPRRLGRLRRLHSEKPATKLYNAWHAGVPAVLGPEVAFRELRRSPLDYLEVSSVAEARDAVRRLAGDPRLYRAMVDNGRERARECSFAAIEERWLEVLTEVIPDLLPALRSQPLRRLPLAARAAVRKAWRLGTFQPSR